LTGALALALSISLAACSKSDAGDGGSSATAPVGTSTSTAGMATGTATDTVPPTATDGSGTSTGTASSSVTASPADQSTPEAAMTSWLGAMVSGDGNTVCRLMSTGGKPIPSIPGAAAACGKKITPMLDQLKELGAAFKGLQITGATVKGDTATFDSVTTEPALAADVVRSFKAVRIGGKWYVTQGWVRATEPDRGRMPSCAVRGRHRTASGSGHDDTRGTRPGLAHAWLRRVAARQRPVRRV